MNRRVGLGVRRTPPITSGSDGFHVNAPERRLGEWVVIVRFSQFADFVNGFIGERPKGQRLGQWAFNLLWEAYPDIATKIRGTESDPFYADSKVPDFLRRLLDFVEMDDPSL